MSIKPDAVMVNESINAIPCAGATVRVPGVGGGLTSYFIDVVKSY